MQIFIMAKKHNSNCPKWSEQERLRMEYFLLLISKLQMHPSDFLNKWQGIKVAQFAELLEVENSKIYHWCSPSKPNISKYYLQKIALLDLFFEHFEDIPAPIWKKLMG